MTGLCPRPCCQLLSAVMFIIIGVVQAIAGAILLRSKYASLLSGPNFWTSASNITVGCLLGIAASIWKIPRSRRSPRYARHIARNKLVTSLLASSLTLNATTLTILMLGEGDSLLSIQLQDKPTLEQSDLGKDVLTYAFATSVVCPVLCIILALTRLASSCFPTEVKEKRKTSFPKPYKPLENSDSKPFEWVFGTEDKSPLSCVPRPSSSSSCSESDFSLGTTSLAFSSPHLHTPHTPSVSELQESLIRLGLGKKSNTDNETPPPLKGEIVAVQIPRRSCNGRDAVHSPTIPMFVVRNEDLPDKSAYALPAKVKTRSNYNFRDDQTSFSTFKATLNDQLKEEFIKNCPKVDLGNRQYHSKSPAMESIMENPVQEQNQIPSPVQTSGYISSPEGISSVVDISTEQTSSVTYVTTPKKKPAFTRATAAFGKVSLFCQETHPSEEAKL